MDICEIIQHQHDEQRRQFAELEQWPRDDTEGLGAVWERLVILLETHAEAEELHFYPELLALGTGGADADSVDEEVEDAIGDHNSIRDGIRAAAKAKVGSEEWWTAVVDTNVANSKHMGEEERQDEESHDEGFRIPRLIGEELPGPEEDHAKAKSIDQQPAGEPARPVGDRRPALTGNTPACSPPTSRPCAGPTRAGRRGARRGRGTSPWWGQRVGRGPGA